MRRRWREVPALAELPQALPGLWWSWRPS